MKKIVFISFLLLLLIGGIWYSYQIPSIFSYNSPKVVTPISNASPTLTASKILGVTHEGLVAVPKKFQIASIGVNAHVEEVGLDDQNRMDVPKEVNNVAWYRLGYKPGEAGSAVIAGHYDTKTGDPAVFFDLNRLNVDDEIVVTDENGKEYAFKIVEKTLYDFDKLPLDEIFAKNDKARLNLITCNGAFDQESKNYSKRLVVFAQIQN